MVITHSLSAQQNIDSLIATWNKLASDYLLVNQIDSACKYGNCVIEMMEEDLELRPEQFDPAERRNLKKQKAEALSNLVTAYGSSDRVDHALSCYESALVTYRELNEPEELFHLHVRMGRVYDMRSGYLEAIPYYEKALEQATENGDEDGKGLACYYLGLNNRYVGNYSVALKYHLRDLRIREEMGDKKGIANAYITIAAILKKLNDTEAALERLYQALQLYEEINDTSGYATVLNDLGTTYEMTGDTANELENHLQAARLRELSREYDGLGASNSYIARIFIERKQFGKAIAYLRMADEAFRRSSNPQGIMTSQIDMAALYAGKPDFDSARLWIAQAEETAKEIMNYFGLTRIYTIRGEIDIQQQNRRQAVDNFLIALSYARQQDNHGQIYLLNNLLADTYRTLGDYRSAFEHQQVSLQYKDSIHNRANMTAAVELEMEYNYNKEKIREQLLQEKKDALNEAAFAEQETQKWLFLAGVLLFLVISLGLYSRLRYIRKTSRALMEQKEEAERHRLMAESERERATQSEKAKQQFLANMSHEIRTPMNAIKGMTDIIIRNDHPVSQDKYLNAIRESSENLLVIVNEILDLSKLEAGRIEFEHIEFSPEKVLHDVKNILRFKAEEKGLALNFNLSANVPPFVSGDPTRLNQILVNLGSNAIKFTEKGNVSIEADVHRSDDEKIFLQFRVADTGIGIAPEKMDTIFEVFSQADTDTTRKYGGTGLGLSICKRLAELQNGFIEVRSVRHEGSVFTVTLPFGKASSGFTRPHEELNIKLKDLRILLVEDNEFNVIVARDELESSISGVVIDVADNGIAALELMSANAYDLVLMDIQMPMMDGYEATAKIRAMNGDASRTPIMAMTANVLKEEVDRCYAAGMNAYISKPFNRSELLLNISQLTGHSHKAR